MNTQSSAASVLGPLSQKQRKGPARAGAGDGEASVIGEDPSPMSVSTSGASSRPGTPGSSNPRSQSAGAPQARRSRTNDSAGKSVISSNSAMNSGSAASSLLGPMLAKKG